MMRSTLLRPFANAALGVTMNVWHQYVLAGCFSRISYRKNNLHANPDKSIFVKLLRIFWWNKTENLWTKRPEPFKVHSVKNMIKLDNISNLHDIIKLKYTKKTIKFKKKFVGSRLAALAHASRCEKVIRSQKKVIRVKNSKT